VAGGRRRNAGARAFAALAGLSAVLAVAPPATAGPNRCGTAPPERSPTWQDGAGDHWFDENGLATRAPQGSPFGHGGVHVSRPSVEVDPLANRAAQVYVGPNRQCAIVGDVGNAPNVGEFADATPPAIVPLPWLRRDGRLFRADDGRTTILRGVDWPYNAEIFEAPYDLQEADFERMASWGINLLRVRIAGYRSGYLPGHPAEPGYWEHLDHLIAAANRHGIYVLPATVTGDLEALVVGAHAHERLKFVEGTANRAWWLDFQAKLFERYRDWPGVVGYDTINEDNSYPPYVHDRLFMGPAHRAIDAALRRTDDRHIYFQEPSGWAYWGAEYIPGMMNGVDIGDPNRFFCPKWKADGDAALDLETKGRLAQESDAPLFACEYWITKTGDDGTVNAQQRAVLAAMDEQLVGGVRVLYGPSNGYGTQLADGSEAPWVAEFARPYPLWAGGTITSIDYDFGARELTVGFDLDGSGPSEVFVPARHYPDGFVAHSSNGADISWDAARQRVVLPAGTGAVTLTIAPR
jgi:hypothetical protein